MTQDKEYYEYLHNITWKGRLYREKLIYPIINKWALGNILDIGCGLGLFLQTNDNALGVDINEHCVLHCQGLLPDRVQIMKENQLPFSSNTFGSIVLDNVIEHIDDPTLLIEEAIRVSRKNGRIIILVPGRKGFTRDADHKTFYDFNGIKELAMRHDLKVLFQRSLPFPFLSKILSSYCYFNVLEC